MSWRSTPRGARPGSPLGDRVHGQVAAAYEVDGYTVSLGAGRYDVETLSFCGAATDTRLAVVDAEGQVIASDDDGGEGFFAAIYGLEIPAAATLEVRVSGSGPSVGEYLVVVTPAQD